MAWSMVKLVHLMRKKWQSKTSSKLGNSKRQVSDQCLGVFSRLFSSLTFRKRQEKGVKNPSCSEATHALEIPEDLVEEILHRVPVKSLMRFKSVSRGWKSLIESGHLAKKHLRFRQKMYGVDEMKVTIEWTETRDLCVTYYNKYCDTEGYYKEPEHFLRVAGSCDGLVCVYDLVNVYLANPSTNVMRTVTPPQGSMFSVGFGRDVVAGGTYKVVVVYNLDEIMVFNPATSEWRCRDTTAGPLPLSFTQINPERDPICVNGSLFWLLKLGHSEILVMDLHTEKFRTVPLPNNIDGAKYMWSQEDRLCVSNLEQGLNSYVWVLVQDEVSERWEEIYGFTTHDIVIPPFELNSAWLSQSLVCPYQCLSHF